MTSAAEPPAGPPAGPSAGPPAGPPTGPPAGPPAGRAPRRWLRELLLLAWPLVVSRSSQAVIGFADGTMAGRLGEDALAATTTGALDALTLFIGPMGVVFIVSSYASQLTGRGDPRRAQRYALYGLAVAAATELLCVAAIPLVPSALDALGYAPAVQRLMTDYLAYRLVSGGAVVGLEALGNFYGGLGQTRLPMIANLIAMALNVALNWVLIFGHLGAPALGVRGAALASSVATVAGFAVLLGAFLAGVAIPGGRRPSRLRAGELARMLRFGVPNGLNWFFEFLAFAFFVNVVVGGLGTTSLAALMAVMQLNSLAFMPAFGVASAGAILAGQEIGAGRPDQVSAVLRRTLALAAGWQGLVGIAYLVAPAALVRLFAEPGQDTSTLVTIGGQMLAISVAWQLFDASATVFAEALRAAGDTAFCLFARLVIAWTIFVPGSLATARWLDAGPRAVTAWLVAYLGLLALTLALRYRAGVWRRIDLAGGGGEERLE